MTNRGINPTHVSEIIQDTLRNMKLTFQKVTVFLEGVRIDGLSSTPEKLVTALSINHGMDLRARVYEVDGTITLVFEFRD